MQFLYPHSPQLQIEARNARNDKARPPAWLGLLAASLLLLALIVPWTDLQNHGHWPRVRWVPFISRPESIVDMAGNLLLAVPIGVLAARVFRRPVLSAGILTLTLSMTGEWTQVYSHSRYPSATDVMCNVAGALAAAALVRRSRTKNRE